MQVTVVKRGKGLFSYLIRHSRRSRLKTVSGESITPEELKKVVYEEALLEADRRIRTDPDVQQF